MDGRIGACFPEMGPMVGFAATAAFRSSCPPGEGSIQSNIVDQVERFGELSGPPVVVFQDLDDPPVGATFGEVMCTTYQTFGAVGLVTSGAGRDLEQVRTIGFPVFTSGTICAHAYCHVLDIYTPVHVGGIPVYPDDLLHGDLNGVTTVPHEIAADVSDTGEEYVAAEAIILELLRGGRPSAREVREAQAEAAACIQGLRERLSGKGNHRIYAL